MLFSWAPPPEGGKWYMKINRLETLRVAEFPNLVWLRVHTDQGVAGLGETSYAAQSVEAYLHEYVAPRVLGRDPLEIEALARFERRDARHFRPRPRALGPVRQGREPAALPGAGRGEPAAHPHLQHLRRLSLRARRGRTEHEELGSRRQAAGTLRGPRRVPAPRRR